jgi:hypothetical protein
VIWYSFPVFIIFRCSNIKVRQVSAEDAQAQADELSINYSETSAKNPLNVQEAFVMITRLGLRGKK